MPELDEHNQLHILGETIAPGKNRIIDLITTQLYTRTKVKVPVIVERAKKSGPILLITAGIHGDELNGVEVVRQFISRKMNKPKRGTIICIPVINVFGFLNMNRYFPDKRDLNRSFPGFKNGSLASRFAYQFTHEILPFADLCLDFHTGGAMRFNAAQIRVTPKDAKSLAYAKIFNAPFTMNSLALSKSYRKTCVDRGIPYLIFEGGKSEDNNKDIAQIGVNGLTRILNHLGMLRKAYKVFPAPNETIFIEKSHWIRANYSGLLHRKTEIGAYVNKGEHLASITDPYGSFRRKIKASHEGYIINVNEAPIVYQGDAVFHVTTKLRS